MPAEVERLARVEPVYETLPGWQKSLNHVRQLADLPPPARAYLDRPQDLAHAPIQYVSVGSHLDQIIGLPLQARVYARPHGDRTRAQRASRGGGLPAAPDQALPLRPEGRY